MIEILCVDGITREFSETRNIGFYCRNCKKYHIYKPEEHTCELTYKTLATKGMDQWGRIWNFTGHEEKGHCFWCGKIINSRRYCDKSCQKHYFQHFFWLDARDWCLERYDHICQGCGSKGDLDVHHIIPVKESGYGWNILNRPENLIPLCKKCHGETRMKPVLVESDLAHRQLDLF